MASLTNICSHQALFKTTNHETRQLSSRSLNNKSHHIEPNTQTSCSTNNQAERKPHEETREENLNIFRNINKKITKEIKHFMREAAKTNNTKKYLTNPQESMGTNYQLEVTKVKYSPEIEQKVDDMKRLYIDNYTNTKSSLQPGSLIPFGHKNFSKCSSENDKKGRLIMRNPEEVGTRKYSTNIQNPLNNKKQLLSSASNISISMRLFNTSSTMYKSNNSNKECKKAESKEDKTCPKLKSCCPPRARKECTQNLAFPPCCKQRSPYKSFTELSCHDLPEILSECPPAKYLQPRFPILSDLKVLEPPPPKSGRIDPDLEEDCLLTKMCKEKPTDTLGCNNMTPRKTMRQKDFMEDMQRTPCNAKAPKCPEDVHKVCKEADGCETGKDKKGESNIPICPPPPPCPPTCSPPPVECKTLWDRIVDYFKPRPNCPAPDEWKKKYLREKAEKAAKDAGLTLCEPTTTPLTVNVAKHYSTRSSQIGCSIGRRYYSRKSFEKKEKACTKPPAIPCSKEVPPKEAKPKETYSTEVKVGSAVPSCDKTASDPCKTKGYDSCQPRARETCEPSIVHPPCCVVEAPYPAFTEIHPPFQRIPPNECTEQDKLFIEQCKRGHMKAEKKDAKKKKDPKCDIDGGKKC